MFFSYGGYDHDANEANLLSWSERPIYNQRLKRQVVRKTMTIEGNLLPDTASQDSIKNKIEELEAAYARDGENAGLYHDNGTPSPHFLDSSSTIGGVRIIEKSFPKGNSAEYSVWRNYRITLEADFPVFENELVLFEENLSITGNSGPRRVVIESRVGAPQLQVTTQRTLTTAVQSGRAIGFTRRPQPARVLFPHFLQDDRVTINRIAPQTQGNRLVNWGIQWNYPYLSPIPLFGVPNTTTRTG
jgi:hypothetical protein